MIEISNRERRPASKNSSVSFVLRLLLFVVTVTAALSLSGTKSYAADEYPVWVGGVQVTSENMNNITGPGITGHVSYEPDTRYPNHAGTLTLDNATITGTYNYSANNSANIYASEGTNNYSKLTIKLIGDNKLTEQNFCVKGAEVSLEFTGGGSLTATTELRCIDTDIYLALDNVKMSLKGEQGLWASGSGGNYITIKNSKVDALTSRVSVHANSYMDNIEKNIIIENSIINLKATNDYSITTNLTIEISGDSLVIAEGAEEYYGTPCGALECANLILNDSIVLQEPTGGAFDSTEKKIKDSNGNVATKAILANDASYQNYKASLINNTSSKTNKPAVKDNSPSSHTHSYSWVVTKYPTSTSDGEEAYMCSCGEIARTSILPAISAFEEEVINKIKNAPANGVVEVETRLFNSFGIGVRDALVARPDVTLKVSFLSEGYKGQLLKVTIPAGIDRKALFEESGWLGLCWYGSTHGYDQ